MRLCSVELVNFRNYERLQLEFPEGTLLLFGQNAQGKTNLLEAIYLCTCARSHRTGRDEELIRHGEDFYRATVGFVTDRGIGETVSIEYRRTAGRKGTPARVIRYNGLEIGRLADMMGLFHAILFAPEDLQIIKDGPAERRRFLDILISRTDRAYFRDLQEFWRTLAHRNHLLKHLRSRGLNREADRSLPGGSVSQLAVWDESLAGYAGAILEKRLAFVERLSELASQSLRHLTASREALALDYRSFPGLMPDLDRAAIARLYLERLARAREDDLMRGSTSQGPHRDDIQILLNGRNARLFASQGQQRSAVLSLKMAELAILTETTGERPILLLDDVMSELDEARRSRLLEVIEGHQVFITCTEPGLSLKGESCPTLSGPGWPGPARHYRVADGRVELTQVPETA